MSAATQALPEGAHAAPTTQSLEAYRQATVYNRMGLWLFILSETFMFVALLATRFYLWGLSRPHTDQVLGLIVTVILLLSSVSMNRAEVSIMNDDRKAFLRWLLATVFFGIVFLIGVVGFEWRGHIHPTDGAYGAVVFGLTGVHALHVLSGIILILLVWNLGRKGSFSGERHWGVEATAVYWHFIDVVWVFFYPALYLIGTPPH